MERLDLKPLGDRSVSRPAAWGQAAPPAQDGQRSSVPFGGRSWLRGSEFHELSVELAALRVCIRKTGRNVVGVMKIRLLPLAIFAALLASGCGKKENVPATVAEVTGSAGSSSPTAASTGTPAATASSPAAAPTAVAAKTAGDSKSPAAASASGGRVIEITANDQMQFNLKTIEAKAGEELKVVLKNIGTLPKEAMGHNWVLLKAGTDPMAFGAASMTAKDTDYIGASVKDQVVAFIKILGPKQTADVTFKAPAPGEYPYICSFPGHVALMKGTLIVK